MFETRSVLRPNRSQLELRPVNLEELLPADHRARSVWEYVGGLDLGPWYETIRSIEGEAGRPAIDPAILLSLWLYATIEGVGSARAIARACEEHDAYRWICGGVRVSYRTLAAFRVAHEEKLDALLTETVSQLEYAGLVSLKRIAQDGMRVRAWAGAASFRSEDRLLELEQRAREQVRRLRQELDDDPGGLSRREKAARDRVARERSERVQRALATAKERREKKKKPSQRDSVRTSTTDPDASVMKMADGGFRPAYNTQLAVDVESQVVVGVETSESGSDMNQLPEMIDQLEERYGRTPSEALVDGGFASLDSIQTVEERGCRVYAPPMTPRDPSRDRYAALPEDSSEIARWRSRMGRASAKRKYKDRASTVECVNAQMRNRGLQQFNVRGRARTRCVALIHALAHNLMRALALQTPQGAPT